MRYIEVRIMNGSTSGIEKCRYEEMKHSCHFHYAKENDLLAALPVQMKRENTSEGQRQRAILLEYTALVVVCNATQSHLIYAFCSSHDCIPRSQSICLLTEFGIQFCLEVTTDKGATKIYRLDLIRLHLAKSQGYNQLPAASLQP